MAKLDFDFLAINKDWFAIGMNPVELLIISQVAEFNRNTGDCFISDDAMAEMFGVSRSTIARAVNRLANELGYIVKETKNTRGGKERHMKVNCVKIKEKIESLKKKDEEESANVKMTLDGCEQVSKCYLASVNLTLANKQNESIKENIKEKGKDNIIEMFHPSDESISLSEPQEEKGESFTNPIAVEREWFIERYNHTDWIERSHVCGIYYHTPSRKYYKIKVS